MLKTAQKGSVNILLVLFLIIGIIVGVYLVRKPTNILPKAYEAKNSLKIVNLNKYASAYIDSAKKNIKTLPDGRQVIVPSGIYTDDGMYIRDAFYATQGLEDISLSEDCFRFFEQTQAENGQVHYAVAINEEQTNSGYDFGFKEDESNLLYIIWAGILSKEGVSLGEEKVEKAYSFIKTRVQDGWYISTPGDYRYWVDTYINTTNDTITYNQGLYALSLRFLNEMRPDLVPDKALSQAEKNYSSLFDSRFGFLLLSRNTLYQDTSALLPEFLTRLYFNKGMLQDDQVLTAVDRMIKYASVYDEQGRLQGIKTLYGADGSFLHYEVFKPPQNNKGVYQNGGYWPMYVLTDLALAYKISGDNKYKSITEELVEKELGSDGRSKEFIYLEQRRIGLSDPERSDYSWNALITTALKWSGMI